MRVFRDLVIRGEPEQVDAVAEDVSRSLPGGWARDTEAETHLLSRATNGRRIACCLTCPARPRRPAATVFVVRQDPGILTVSNIVPHGQGRLSCEDYNAVLEDFYRYAGPIAARHGARAELTAAQADLERWLTSEAADKLRLFSSAANKWTGSCHPLDRERWYDFIVAAEDATADFSPALLAQWLTESGGWDEAKAAQLAAEYEFAHGLLAFARAGNVAS